MDELELIRRSLRKKEWNLSRVKPGFADELVSRNKKGIEDVVPLDLLRGGYLNIICGMSCEPNSPYSIYTFLNTTFSERLPTREEIMFISGHVATDIHELADKALISYHKLILEGCRLIGNTRSRVEVITFTNGLRPKEGEKPVLYFLAEPLPSIDILESRLYGILRSENH